jgi:hypothetical protein
MFPLRPGPRRPFTRGSLALLSHRQGYLGLDPRPHPSPRPAIFTRNADKCFSGSDCRPPTSAIHFRRTDTPSSVRFPLLRSPAFLRNPEAALRFRGSFYEATAFPSRRKATKSHEPRQPFRHRPTALQIRRRTRPRKLSPYRNAACGRHPDPATACGDDRWTTALDCTGRVALSEGPSLGPPAAAVRLG